jgi:hypothetical protein
MKANFWLPYSVQGEFINSRQDNRSYFSSVFGEELADYLLKLIEQDATS